MEIEYHLAACTGHFEPANKSSDDLLFMFTNDISYGIISDTMHKVS